MTEERRKALLDLGIDMTTADEVENDDGGDDADDDKESNRASKWDEKFHELKQYKAANGHTNVPRRSKRDPSKDALGEWVHFQRRQHRNLLTGKNSTMSIARKKALDCLDFQWTRSHGPSTTTRTGTTYSTDIKEAVAAQIKTFTSAELAENWDERFAEFEVYVQTHGNGSVPSNYRENPFLARWAYRQIELYNVWRQTAENAEMLMQQEGDDQNPNSFAKEKYEKLLAAGFVFEKPIEIGMNMDEEPQEEEGVENAASAYVKEGEEERPTLEDNDDVIEIFIGYDGTHKVASEVDLEHQVVPAPEPMPTLLEQAVAATEPVPVSAEAPNYFNESDAVNAILEGKDDHHQHHHMEHSVPMPSMMKVDAPVVNMQGIEPTDVHNGNAEQQPQIHIEQPMGQQPVSPQPKVAMARRLTARVKVEWEERVLELIQFKLRKTHCNVPAKWKPNPDLADWVWKQRAQYRRYRQNQPSILTASRITKLADLGFEFVALDHHGLPIDEVDSKLYTNSDLNKLQATKKTSSKRKGTPKSRFKEGKWLESLAKVVKYKEENGNCNVPRKWKRDPTLGEWVHFQRRQFRLRQLNRRNHMTDERIRKLEAVGFEWSRGTANQPTYIRLYEQNKELASQMPNAGHQLVEGATDMAPVPADVSQLGMMDGEEQVRAEEIAAVVEEQLKHPGEGEVEEHQHHHHSHQMEEHEYDEVVDHRHHEVEDHHQHHHEHEVQEHHHHHHHMGEPLEQEGEEAAV